MCSQEVVVLNNLSTQLRFHAQATKFINELIDDK